MKATSVKNNNGKKENFEEQLIDAAKRNDIAFWTKSSRVKHELNSRKLLSNIPESFILQPKIFNYLLKNMDNIEELKKLPFKGNEVDMKLLKTIVDHFENYYDPMSYLPKIKNSKFFCQILSACDSKKVSVNYVLGLILVMDKTLFKDSDAVIGFLKYFTKHCTSNDELCLILAEIPDGMNEFFADKCLDCTSYVFTVLKDEDFSDRILKDREFIKNKKLFVKVQ